ncbi:phage tail assembly chaperone [Caulobacter sp. UNC358MFTsu5.1]|uniref:phage tail assembly chaperone n=1 Tax=Caulobacter sp. UNC358MFTsu5.1 TaxID=1449049 RepID=UPI0004A6C211|nr:phage tail assembly chaperone [Caulobacter sp. UNC358MFTsu5.1]
MTARWRDALRLAALHLAIPPEAFWRLSLAEWRALTEAPAAPVLDRAALGALIARFPDEETP